MPRTAVLILLVAIATAPAAYTQSIRADQSVGTEGQLVSGVATGTPPLVVSSTTKVSKLHADRIDGLEGMDLALEADLQSAEAMLVVLRAQVDALGAALVARTGQTTCYDAAGGVVACTSGIGLGQDGDLQPGVPWPIPRFIKNGDGTVSDNLTGLVWLEDVGCFNQFITWDSALTAAAGLFDGSTNDPTGGDCGLSDGSVAGQWRVPSLRELHSLIHYGVSSVLAIPNTAGTGTWVAGDPFVGILNSTYWSSTSRGFQTNKAWYVGTTGDVGNEAKSSTRKVWPVRSGS